MPDEARPDRGVVRSVIHRGPGRRTPGDEPRGTGPRGRSGGTGQAAPAALFAADRSPAEPDPVGAEDSEDPAEPVEEAEEVSGLAEGVGADGDFLSARLSVR